MSVNSVNSDGSLLRVAGGTLYADLAVGSIVPFGGSTAPNGFLLCNGAEVLKTAYAELYAVIGDAFGTASDNTKFKLPDLRGEFLRGAGTNSHTGEGSGGDVGVHQGATQVPLITLRQNDITTANFNNQITNNTVENADYNTLLQTANGVGIDYSLSGTVYSTSLDSIRYTTRPTNTSVNYIIKAKQVAVPFDVAEYVRKWDELEPIPSVRIGGFTGWTQGDLTKNYTMEHDGMVNVFLDENISYYVITDLNGSETQIYAPSVHGSCSSAMSLFLKKGYKIKLSTNSHSGLSVQYYLNRD